MGSIPGSGRPPEKEMATPPPKFFAWEIPWTEEPGGLQTIGSQRVGHDLGTKQQVTLAGVSLTVLSCCLFPHPGP